MAKIGSKSFCFGVEAEIKDEKKIIEPETIDTGFYTKALAVAAMATVAGCVVKFSAGKL